MKQGKAAHFSLDSAACQTDMNENPSVGSRWVYRKWRFNGNTSLWFMQLKLIPQTKIQKILQCNKYGAAITLKIASATKVSNV